MQPGKVVGYVVTTRTASGTDEVEYPVRTHRVTVEGGALFLRLRRVCTMIEGDNDELLAVYGPGEWVRVIGRDALA